MDIKTSMNFFWPYENTYIIGLLIIDLQHKNGQWMVDDVQAKFENVFYVSKTEYFPTILENILRFKLENLFFLIIDSA